MSSCISYTATRDRCYRRSFSSAGLRSATIGLHGGATTIHCWVPRLADPAKSSLLLVHGFGANATWQWDAHLRPLLAGFNVYVPDLVFFGESFTTRPDRTVSFQAECIAEAMDALGVERASLVGISYGGFVGYALAAAHPDRLERVVLCCTGVCLEEKDLRERLFVVEDVREASALLIPQTPERLRRLMQLSFVRPPRGVPSCFLSDFIQVMCTEYVEEKTELILTLIKDRKLSDLPKISKQTLIIWGEQDQIFPLELGYRLNRHLEGNSELVIIKNAGHAVNLEKPKEFCKHLKSFLIDSSSKTSKASQKKCHFVEGLKKVQPPSGLLSWTMQTRKPNVWSMIRNSIDEKPLD
ncbi:hypothetical protein Taro_022705 [Colocasia esculenta]|uniref:AB hydrolase-1 domain-containing protein n=1 Tax=Colocasia esculenta TaxID=4460 RepID=A0A843UV66_COLES|nr:hypothetical protein [Colocasia esculenta]